jgi:hypothetical protein
MCPEEGTDHSASFSSLPTHVQSLVFAAAGASLTTCKASAALAQDACLIAEWLLQRHPSQPLEWAAKHQMWDVCHQLLTSLEYQPKGQELCIGLGYSGKYGEAALMSRLLQWSCQGQHNARHDTCMVCASVRGQLVLAAGAGHVDVASVLLDHPSCTAQIVRDAVCEAACRGQLEVLQLLVSSRPDAGSPKLRGSPMGAAAMYGDVAAMEVLVQHGADVNGSKGSPWRSDEDSAPPLLEAVMRGQVAAVAWLLQQGINADGRGLGMALKLAAYRRDPTLVRMLLSYSPTQAIIRSHGTSALLTDSTRVWPHTQ